ncbi:MAG: hypothetical protein ABR511_06450 [Acidimicrobiales bacterium]
MTLPVAGSPADAPGSGGPSQAEQPRTGGPLFWTGVVVGWVVMAAGVRGLLHDHVATNPTAVGRLFVESALLHDLILAPLVCGIGLLLARLLPPRLRAIVGGGIIASAVVSLYSFPFVRGYGRDPNLPSALSRNYGRGLVLLLAAIWLVVVALAALAIVRRRAPGRP